MGLKEQYSSYKKNNLPFSLSANIQNKSLPKNFYEILSAC